MDDFLVVEGLQKAYGKIKALDGVSFRVKRGEIYGLLGPNGAGKTTTIKIITGILKPDNGNVFVFGKSPLEDPIYVKNVIGYVPEEVILYESLTVKEFFEFIASIRGLNRDDVIERVLVLVKSFGFSEYFDTPILSLSQGTKQKVAIVAALMHKPRLLVLDEPIKGLDAMSARVLKEILQMHIQNGGAVLFSTHIMELAENICTRIGIIHRGKIIAEGTMDELKEMAREPGADLEEVFLTLTEQIESIDEYLRDLRRIFS